MSLRPSNLQLYICYYFSTRVLKIVFYLSKAWFYINCITFFYFFNILLNIHFLVKFIFILCIILNSKSKYLIQYVNCRYITLQFSKAKLFFKSMLNIWCTFLIFYFKIFSDFFEGETIRVLICLSGGKGVIQLMYKLKFWGK